MARHIFSLVAAFTILGGTFSEHLWAAVLSPVATTGHDQDIVFEMGLTSGQRGANGEIGSRQFFEAGVFADGVPRTVTDFVNSLTGNTITFSFPPFESNNIIKLENTTAPKTLTLVAPGAYSQLAIVHSGGSLATATEVAIIGFTINYAGGQMQTGSVNSADWGAVPTLPSGTTRFLIADRTTASATTWPISSDNNTTANRWAIYLSEITPDRPDLNIESVTFGPVSLSNGTTVGPLNSGDDVVVFGLAGTPANVVLTAPAITNQPQNITVEEGRPATFSVGASGSTPLFYQWQKGGVPLGAPNQASYTIAAVTLADAGTYSVVITNMAGTITSSNATLTVLRDTNGPTIIKAVGNAAGDTVTLTFSELLDTNTASEVLYYQLVAAGSGESLIINSAMLTNGTNVILFNDPSSLRLPGQNYTVQVLEVRDVFNNPVNPNPFSIQVRPDLLLIGFDTNNEWKYEISGTNLTGTGWQNSGYDDTGWLSGPAGLGLDVSSNGVPIRTTLPYTATNNTTYFRKRFTLPVGTNDVELALRDVVEDGAVYYLNGQEVWRNRMPAGPVVFATQANPAAPEPALITGPFLLSTTNLLAGENVLAVEVHQNGTASSDLELAVELIANIPGFGPSAPRLEFTRNVDGTMKLTWNAAGFCLEERNTLDAGTVWSSSTIASGVPFNPAGAARFFRLKICN